MTLDLGAHIGRIALHVRLPAGKSDLLICFEPTPQCEGRSGSL